ALLGGERGPAPAGVDERALHRLRDESVVLIDLVRVHAPTSRPAEGDDRGHPIGWGSTRLWTRRDAAKKHDVDFSVRSGTVDRFVALAGSPARGRTLGERIAESFAGLRSVVAHTGGNVFVVDVTSGAGDVLHVDGFDKRDLEDYVAYYRFHDPMAHFMVETNRSIRTLSDAATPLEIARTEYSDLIRRVSVESVAGWSHALGRGRYVAVGIHRAPRMRDFSERERALLEMLVPLIATPAIERA